MRTNCDTGFSGPIADFKDKRSRANPVQGAQGCYNLTPVTVSAPIGKSGCPNLDAYYSARFDATGQAIPGAPVSKIIGKESGINT